MGSGLPLITTTVPPLGKEVEKAGAAIIVKDKKEEIAKAMLKIFEDKTFANKLAQNSIKFAKNNSWENTYENALKKMEIILS